MIDELQFLLDKLGDLTDIALWVVGGFFLFKLVIMLSTTGAIVYVSKLTILSVKEIMTRDKPIPPPSLDYKAQCVNDEVVSRLQSVLARSKRSTGRYLHPSDIDWLEQAIEAKEKANAKKK